MSPYYFRFFFQYLTLATLAFSTVAHAENDLPLIHVSAEGKATAQPDQAELHLDFIAKHFEVEQAREAVDDQVKTLLKKLNRFELDTSSLDSSQTHIYPQYDYQNKQRQFIGYQVNRSVSFVLKKLEQLEDLVQAITESQVTQLNQIQFGLSDPEFTKAEALSNAIRNSRTIAQQLAEGYEVQLGGIHRASHSTTQSPRMMKTMMLQEMAADSAQSSYQQKDLEFKANVEVDFRFK